MSVVTQDILDIVENQQRWRRQESVSYTHLRAHETGRNLLFRLLL